MSVRVLQGHVLDVLEREPAGSVHACVTSPPYWQLRAYGTPPQVWPDGWVGELGQEDTPERFVDHLVSVFGAVKRVLRDDGTLWVNLAGCYWNDAGGQNGAQGSVSPKAIIANGQQGRTRKQQHPVYKALDYVDVPGLVARALQADGWLWRSDVALVKSAPMPESVSGTFWTRCRVKVREGTAPGGFTLGRPDRQHTPTEAGAHFDHRKPPGSEWADCPGCPRCAAHGGLVLRRGSGRPTRAWERLLVFAKRPGYYYDTEAVREPAAVSTLERAEHGYLSGGSKWAAERNDAGKGQRTSFSDWVAGRNARDWLLWRPQPLKAEGDEAEHYAAFPPMLPELAVKAGTSARGCCPGCGAPWARVVETRYEKGYRTGHLGFHARGDASGMTDMSAYPALDRVSTTVDWRPTCACVCRACDGDGVIVSGWDKDAYENIEAPCPRCDGGTPKPVPCTVMDCFGGSGTSGIVADRLGRDAVLVELKPAYARLAERRLHRDAPLLLWGQVTLEGATSPEPAEEPEELTKQERHPNRTVASFNQRGKANTTPRVPEGVPLPLEALEEPEDAVAGG